MAFSRARLAVAPPPSEDVLWALHEGGDARILPDANGRTPYGVSLTPGATDLEFSSSTASSLSFDAATFLHQLWVNEGCGVARDPVAEQAWAERIRKRLSDLITGAPQGRRWRQPAIALAASGTDAHLILAQYMAAATPKPLSVLMVDPSETGSGVPLALAGRNFGTETWLAGKVEKGSPLGPNIETDRLDLRDANGVAFSDAQLAATLQRKVFAAVGRGRHVLLILVDGSKSGRIAPDLETVLNLARALPLDLTVAVDACQFRCSPKTLCAYLDQGFAVLVTGSKFFTGPTYSAAILTPEDLSARFAAVAFPPALEAFVGASDLPSDWAPPSTERANNRGLLLRWEAALFEMERFLRLPDADVRRLFVKFDHRVRGLMSTSAIFAPLPAFDLDRSALGAPPSWDNVPTIIRFRLRRHRDAAAPYLDEAELRTVQSTLQRRPHPVQLGQPVRCGGTAETPEFALRFCASSRLAALALASPSSEEALFSAIAFALRAIERVVLDRAELA